MSHTSIHYPFDSLKGDEKDKTKTLLNEFLDSLSQSALSSKREVSKKWGDYLKFARGKHWPSNLPKHRVDFTLPLVRHDS